MQCIYTAMLNSRICTSVLWNQHTPVPHLALPKSIHRVCDTLLRHGEFHVDRLDLMLGSKLQHVAVDGTGGDNASLDPNATEEQAQIRDSEIALRNREREDLAVGRHERQNDVPV